MADGMMGWHRGAGVRSESRYGVVPTPPGATGSPEVCRFCPQLIEKTDLEIEFEPAALRLEILL